MKRFVWQTFRSSVVAIAIIATTAWAVTAPEPGQGSQPPKETESKSKTEQTAKPKGKPKSTPGKTNKKSAIKTLTMPTDEKPDRFGKTNADVEELCFSQYGDYILTKSSEKVICWDVATGAILQTYEPPKRRLSYQKPLTKHIFLAPNASVVAIYKENEDDSSEVSLYEAQTGKKIGSYSLGKKLTLYEGCSPDSFTPSGTHLLIQGGRSVGPKVLFAVSTMTGKGFLVNAPLGERTSAPAELILPHPTEPFFFELRRTSGAAGESGITALNLKTQERTAVKGFTANPGHLFYDRALEISPDGKLLLMHSLKDRRSHDPSAVQVCEWESGKLLANISEEMVHWTNSHFTPDGKRFFVVRNADYYELNIGSGKSQQDVPDTIDLYDIASKRKLGSFNPEKLGIPAVGAKGDIRTVALSGDGRKLAFSQGRSVHIIDFRPAFNCAPLWAVLPPPVQYSIPVGKEENDDSMAAGAGKSRGRSSTAKPPSKEEAEKRRADMKARAEKLRKDIEKKRKQNSGGE